MEDYLDLLEESLVKKSAILDKIEEFNLKQKNIFTVNGEEPDFEKFDSYVEEKGKLIDELNSLDNGFETLYERVADTLKENKKDKKAAGSYKRDYGQEFVLAVPGKDQQGTDGGLFPKYQGTDRQGTEFTKRSL